jgi:hypothetical protein
MTDFLLDPIPRGLSLGAAHSYDCSKAATRTSNANFV